MTVENSIHNNRRLLYPRSSWPKYADIYIINMVIHQIIMVFIHFRVL